MKQFVARDIRRLVGTDSPLILEIGCNRGQDTAAFLDAMPQATIHCFECEPRAIEKFKAAITSPQVHLHEVALCDREGVMPFHPSGGTPPKPFCHREPGPWDQSGSLLSWDRHSKFTTWLRNLDPYTVPTTTLDLWADRTLDPHGPIDFVWADIQGAEHLMLRGAEKTMPRVRWFYCECDPRPLYHGMATLADLDALLPGFERQRTEYRGFNWLWRNTE